MYYISGLYKVVSCRVSTKQLVTVPLQYLVESHFLSLVRVLREETIYMPLVASLTMQ